MTTRFTPILTVARLGSLLPALAACQAPLVPSSEHMVLTRQLVELVSPRPTGVISVSSTPLTSLEVVVPSPRQLGEIISTERQNFDAAGNPVGRPVHFERMVTNVRTMMPTGDRLVQLHVVRNGVPDLNRPAASFIEPYDTVHQNDFNFLTERDGHVVEWRDVLARKQELRAGDSWCVDWDAIVNSRYYSYRGRSCVLVSQDVVYFGGARGTVPALRLELTGAALGNSGHVEASTSTTIWFDPLGHIIQLVHIVGGVGGSAPARVERFRPHGSSPRAL